MRQSVRSTVVDEIEGADEVVGGFFGTDDIASRSQQVKTFTAVGGAFTAGDGMQRLVTLFKRYHGKDVEIRPLHPNPVGGK